jgi:hypothetical protein
MTRARIYRPAKSAMQSGRANTRKWIVEFEPSGGKSHDPLMGWVSSTDTAQQVRMKFDSEEAAIAFCKRKGMDYVLREPHQRKIRPKSYAENFKWERVR